MWYAIGRRLAESVSENLVLFIGIVAIIALALMWPTIVRRIEDFWHRH